LISLKPRGTCWRFEDADGGIGEVGEVGEFGLDGLDGLDGLLGSEFALRGLGGGDRIGGFILDTDVVQISK
jgi:hypothetical protein